MNVEFVVSKKPDGRRKELRMVIDYISISDEGRVSIALQYSRYHEIGGGILWVDNPQSAGWIRELLERND